MAENSRKISPRALRLGERKKSLPSADWQWNAEKSEFAPMDTDFYFFVLRSEIGLTVTSVPPQSNLSILFILFIPSKNNIRPD